MSREIYKETENYIASIETISGYLFLHLDVYKWNKTVCIELREELDKALLKFEEMGHDVLFVTSSSEKSVKMWNMIKPCFTVHKLEKGPTVGWMGSWITGEGEWA